MTLDFTKSEKRKIRELADLAWERLLKPEISKISHAIPQMEVGEKCPHEVSELIHEFHNGISRDLFRRFGDARTWFGVCRARYDGIPTESDCAEISDDIRKGFESFGEMFEHYEEDSNPSKKKRPS